MTRNRSLLVFACFALGFGFTQSAFSQWWPATGTDTTNEWGSGGWGSFVEIYVDQVPLAELKARDPECELKPKECKDPTNFKFIFTDGTERDSFKGVLPPKLNGLSLDSDPANDIPSCGGGSFDAKITGKATATSLTPTIAVCIIRDDAGNLLPDTTAYCAVDVTVNDVVVSDDGDGGDCVYSRRLARGESGETVFGELDDSEDPRTLLTPSSVTLFASRADAQINPALSEDFFPKLEPENVPQCGDTGPLTGACTIDVGLPTGVVCPDRGQPNCLSSLLPAVAPFDFTGYPGEVLIGREDQNLLALRYCVGDVGGGNIRCQGTDKQVETAEAAVIIECLGSHSPTKATLNATGSNTHKFDYLADCFPELDSEGVTTSGTIEFETVVNDVVTSPSAANPSRIEPTNECQLGGDTAMPSKLTCFVPETRLVEGCQQTCKLLDTASDDTTGCVDEIRGRAVVNVDGNDVPLIAIDDNGGNGFLCKL